MLVATAERGSIPNCNMAGTVMSEVLPVTTLTMLVKKKMALRPSSWISVKSYTSCCGGTSAGTLLPRHEAARPAPEGAGLALHDQITEDDFPDPGHTLN
jgi:hypothetical protein